MPFDFERRRVSVLVREGRPPHPGRQGRAGGCAPALEPLRGAGLAIPRPRCGGGGEGQGAFDSLGSEGFRVLGIAWRETAPDHAHAVVGDEQELIFAGFAAFLDPPKKGRRGGPRKPRRSGIAVKILTGDNERVDAAPLRRARHPVDGHAHRRRAWRAMERQALERPRRAARRSSAASRRRRRTASSWPSSAAATSSASWATASTMRRRCTARTSASPSMAPWTSPRMPPTSSCSSAIWRFCERGVREGRRTFGNVMKYVIMGTSSNFGNMFCMAGAALVLPFLPMLSCPDSAEQLPLRSVGDRHPDGSRRSTEAMAHAAALEYPLHPQLHAGASGPVSSLFDFLDLRHPAPSSSTPARRSSRRAGSSSPWRPRCW